MRASPSLLFEQILSLKHRIQDDLKLGDVSEQKLIYLGKILSNETTIQDSKVKTNDTIVVMTSKVKAKPAAPSAPAPAPVAAAAAAPAGPSSLPAVEPVAAAAPTPAAEPAAAPAPAPTPVAAPPAVAVAAPAAAPAAAAAQSVAASAASSVQMGAAYEESLLGLMSLGFERQQAADAMRAAYNNADRAAEYLFGPESVLRAALAQANAGSAGAGAAQPRAPATPAQPNAATQSGSGNANPSAGDLLNLASGAGVDQAQISQLRALLQSNPSLGPALLQQVAQSSPEVMAQLGNNPQALEQLLQGLAGAGGNGGGRRGGSGHRTIQITEEEKQQLDNLEALGFERDVALEAWLICDRNEEVAANWLFEVRGTRARKQAHRPPSHMC